MFSGNIYKLKKEHLSEWSKDVLDENKEIIDSVVPTNVLFKIIDFIDDEYCIVEEKFEEENNWEKIEEPIAISELMEVSEEYQCTPEETKRLSNIIED